MAQIREFTSTNASYFILDGVKYPKSYEAVDDSSLNDNRLKVIPIGRTGEQLLYNTHYKNVRVNGNSFTSLEEAISAINEVVFSKGGGSGDGGTGIQSIQEGDNISIDNTDPLNPIISTEVASEFVKITQGPYTGFGLKGRVDNPTYYSPIGENSIDMGFQDASSSSYPHIAVKMGTRSLSIGGIYNSVSGDESVVIGGGNTSVTGLLSVSVGGFFNNVSGDRAAILGGQNNTASNFCSSVLGGTSNVASGYYSLATGIDNSAKSYGETVIGVAATNYTPNSPTSSNPNDRLFVVGNGTSKFNRSNAFTILKNGLATLPSITNALITSEPTGKVIVTKEWINLRVPQPPTTGTFVLKSINGVTSWVADRLTEQL